MLIKLRFQFPEIVIGIFLAVAIFALGAAWQSSHQSPSAEQTTAADSASNKKIETDSKKTQSLLMPTDTIGLYTAILTAFTGILAVVSIFQGIMLLRADRTTRQSADAAKRAADAAVNVELPILIISFANLRSPGLPQIGIKMPLPENIEPVIAFTNFGRSPAQITKGCLEWTIAKAASELPLPPQYKTVVPYSANAVVINQGRIPLDVPCKIHLTPEQVTALNECRDFLWMFGFIAYNDFLGEPHEVRFCMKWQPDREGQSAPYGFVWNSETPAKYTKHT